MSNDSNDTIADLKETNEAFAIPETAPKLTGAQLRAYKKAKGKAIYRLSVDLAQRTKTVLNTLSPGQIEETLGAYMQMITPPVDPEQKTIEVEVGILQQLSMLAAVSLSRHLSDRYRD